MILGLGTDIVEVSRIEKAVQKKAFCERVFTEEEIAYCEESAKAKGERYAARFAAKEAILKALGTGLSDGLTFLDFEVKKDDKGKPFFVCKGEAEKMLTSLGCTQIHLTMSHQKSYATATVILES